MKKGLSILINILLFAVIVFLAWQVVKSIQAPIKFNTEQKARETKVVERLIDIRNAEVLYKNANNKYTADFDSLIQFCQTAEIPIVKIVPDPTDTTFTRTINDTIGYVKVMDSLKSGRDNFNISDLKWVPFSQPQQNFEIEAGTIQRNGINIPVFEVRTPYEVYLANPGAAFTEKEWKQRVDNTKAEKESINRYAGLKVGSMEEATTDGNWEKL
jgi:type II secretory pathway component PulJ